VSVRRDEAFGASRGVPNKREILRNEILRRCQLICSAPGVVFLGGDLAVEVGGRAVGQALPLRIHVGLELLPSNSREPIEIKCWEWDHAKSVYVAEGLEEPKRDRVLQEICRPLSGKAGASRFAIHVASDYHSKMGGAWAGAFSGSLAAALLFQSNGLTSEDVSNWRQFGTEKLIEDQKFKECFERARRLEVAVHGGLSSGAGAFCSLLGCGYPVWYQRGDSVGPLSGGSRTHQELQYSGSRIIEPAPSPSSEVFLELGLISSGVPRDAEPILHRVADELKQNREMLVRNSERTYEAVCSLLQGNREVERRLAMEMNFARAIFEYLELDWVGIDTILLKCLGIAVDSGIRDKVALKPTGVGKGGFLLCIAPSETGDFYTQVSRELKGPKVSLLWHGNFPVAGAYGLKVEEPTVSPPKRRDVVKPSAPVGAESKMRYYLSRGDLPHYAKWRLSGPASPSKIYKPKADVAVPFEAISGGRSWAIVDFVPLSPGKGRSPYQVVFKARRVKSDQEAGIQNEILRVEKLENLLGSAISKRLHHGHLKSRDGRIVVYYAFRRVTRDGNAAEHLLEYMFAEPAETGIRVADVKSWVLEVIDTLDKFVYEPTKQENALGRDGKREYSLAEAYCDELSTLGNEPEVRTLRLVAIPKYYLPYSLPDPLRSLSDCLDIIRPKVASLEPPFTCTTHSDLVFKNIMIGGTTELGHPVLIDPRTTDARDYLIDIAKLVQSVTGYSHVDYGHNRGFGLQEDELRLAPPSPRELKDVLAAIEAKAKRIAAGLQDTHWRARLYLVVSRNYISAIRSYRDHVKEPHADRVLFTLGVHFANLCVEEIGKVREQALVLP
jgi:mevalonate kinase